MAQLLVLKVTFHQLDRLACVCRHRLSTTPWLTCHHQNRHACLRSGAHMPANGSRGRLSCTRQHKPLPQACNVRDCKCMAHVDLTPRACSSTKPFLEAMAPELLTQMHGYGHLVCWVGTATLPPCLSTWPPASGSMQRHCQAVNSQGHANLAWKCEPGTLTNVL